VIHSARLTRRARNWVRREAEYLNERRPSAAQNFLAVIERVRRQLSEHPLSGPPGEIPDTRRLVVGDYILSYRVRRGVAEVFAIRHARQRDARAPMADA
jgi:plasmid stabilization system protein ParE